MDCYFILTIFISYYFLHKYKDFCESFIQCKWLILSITILIVIALQVPSHNLKLAINMTNFCLSRTVWINCFLFRPNQFVTLLIQDVRLLPLALFLSIFSPYIICSNMYLSWPIMVSKICRFALFNDIFELSFFVESAPYFFVAYMVRPKSSVQLSVWPQMNKFFWSYLFELPMLLHYKEVWTILNIVASFSQFWIVAVWIEFLYLSIYKYNNFLLLCS